MPNAEKIEKVAALKERIQGSEALLLAEYRGLSVHDATELRRALVGAGAVRDRQEHPDGACGRATPGVAELEALLEGPTAVAFVQGDVVATAKKVVDAAKRFPALVLKGGYLDGKVLSAAEAQSLATLESREVMLSKVAGMLKAEMTRAASMFQAIQGRFLGVLEAYKEKLPGEATEAVAPRPTAEAAPRPTGRSRAARRPSPQSRRAARASPRTGRTTDRAEPDARDEATGRRTRMTKPKERRSRRWRPRPR